MWIAIESHRPELLRALLERSHVEYCYTYWGTLPLMFSEIPSSAVSTNRFATDLHRIDPDSDLSFVGQTDCGHMQFDV